jgi:peroxiredoxin
MRDLNTLPPDLPPPVDDGAADHLMGWRLPPVALEATDGTSIDLSQIREDAVVFAYPRTGRPDRPPLVPDWDSIPGARGCTPQTCGFRDHFAEFASLGCRVFGLSTQESAYQREMVHRLRISCPVLSDARLQLTAALMLPTLTVAGETLLKRLAWVQTRGTIVHVWYPVFPPDTCASEVLTWLRERP